MQAPSGAKDLGTRDDQENQENQSSAENGWEMASDNQQAEAQSHELSTADAIDSSDEGSGTMDFGDLQYHAEYELGTGLTLEEMREELDDATEAAVANAALHDARKSNNVYVHASFI